MWQVAGREVDIALFEPFRLADVLYDFDGPRIFTFTNEDDELFLAYQCDLDDDKARYVTVPFSEDLKKKLTGGDISVRDALEQPRVWILDVGKQWEILNAWSTGLAALPDDAVPEFGTMLLPSLEPLISIRTVGSKIREGITPSSVIRNTIDGAEKAIKVLLEYVVQYAQQQGRPAGAIRRLYDLPAQRLAFNSFAISFRRPTEPEQSKMGEIDELDKASEEKIYEEVGQLLQRGLVWMKAKAGDASAIEGTDEDRKVILRALENLAPSTYGPVSAVEISGEMLGDLAMSKTPVRLERGSRAIIKTAISQLNVEKERTIDHKGFVREADKDRFTFELRDDIGDVSGIRFTYDEEFEDEVRAAWNLDYRVRVIGVEEPVKNIYRLLLIVKVDEEAEIPSR